MRARRDVNFYECLDCKIATALHESAAGGGCPECGSSNGRVVSCADLARRIEAAGGIAHIDLSPTILGQSKCPSGEQ
jgi:hypothetical protein